MQATHEQGAQWFGQAISLLPQESASEEDKTRLQLVTVEVAGRDEAKSRLGYATLSCLHKPSPRCSSYSIFFPDLEQDNVQKRLAEVL